MSKARFISSKDIQFPNVNQDGKEDTAAYKISKNFGRAKFVYDADYEQSGTNDKV